MHNETDCSDLGDQPDSKRGLRILILMSLAIFLSLAGVRVVEFVFAMWVYEHSGSMKEFSLVFLFTILPAIFIAPFGGILTDRWSRRSVMLVASAGSVLASAVVAAVVMANRLEVWHVYLFAFVVAVFTALQWPAVNASIALLVPKSQLSRANGLLQLAYAVPQVGAPMLGGVLLLGFRVEGVAVFGLIALILSLVVFSMIRLPTPGSHTAGKPDSTVVWADIRYGWRYICARPPLVALAAFFIVNTFFMGIITVLAMPMILGFSSKAALGTVLSFGGLGMVLGGALTGAQRRPINLVNNLIMFQLLAGLSILAAGITTSISWIAAAAFLYFISWSVVNSCYEAIWQGTVESYVQGRVLSVRQSVTLIAQLISYLCAGTLAEELFEPLLANHGVLAQSIGTIIGTGPGRGIGFLFVLLGCITVVGAALAYLSPRMAQDETA